MVMPAVVVMDSGIISKLRGVFQATTDVITNDLDKVYRAILFYYSRLQRIKSKPKFNKENILVEVYNLILDSETTDTERKELVIFKDEVEKVQALIML